MKTLTSCSLAMIAAYVFALLAAFYGMKTSAEAVADPIVPFAAVQGMGGSTPSAR